MPDIAHVSSLPRITPSAISDLDCGHRYHQLRMLKAWPSRPMIEAVAHSTAVHEVLRLAYAHRIGGRPCLEHVEAWARTAVWCGRFPDGTAGHPCRCDADSNQSSSGCGTQTLPWRMLHLLPDTRRVRGPGAGFRACTDFFLETMQRDGMLLISTASSGIVAVPICVPVPGG